MTTERFLLALAVLLTASPAEAHHELGVPVQAALPVIQAVWVVGTVVVASGLAWLKVWLTK
jgi:hypothetical protein